MVSAIGLAGERFIAGPCYGARRNTAALDGDVEGLVDVGTVRLASSAVTFVEQGLTQPRHVGDLAAGMAVSSLTCRSVVGLGEQCLRARWPYETVPDVVAAPQWRRNHAGEGRHMRMRPAGDRGMRSCRQSSASGKADGDPVGVLVVVLAAPLRRRRRARSSKTNAGKGLRRCRSWCTWPVKLCTGVVLQNLHQCVLMCPDCRSGLRSGLSLYQLAITK